MFFVNISTKNCVTDPPVDTLPEEEMTVLLLSDNRRKKLLTLHTAKLRIPKVAYCCLSMGQISPWSKTAESQLKKVIYGLSLHSSVFYPTTLETLSLAYSLE
jgi:hypothetical protein